MAARKWWDGDRASCGSLKQERERKKDKIAKIFSRSSRVHAWAKEAEARQPTGGYPITVLSSLPNPVSGLLAIPQWHQTPPTSGSSVPSLPGPSPPGTCMAPSFTLFRSFFKCYFSCSSPPQTALHLLIHPNPLPCFISLLSTYHYTFGSFTLFIALSPLL